LTAAALVDLSKRGAEQRSAFRHDVAPVRTRLTDYRAMFLGSPFRFRPFAGLFAASLEPDCGDSLA
jgi:hypothetical protein